MYFDFESYRWDTYVVVFFRVYGVLASIHLFVWYSLVMFAIVLHHNR